MPAKLLMAGYLGCGNQGDDAVLLGLSHELGKLGHDISVLSGSPEETHRLYGFAARPRRDMAAVQDAIDASDALVFPGGSIFQDVTSVRSVYYYTTIIKMAKKAGKKVILVGQGVGPLSRFLGKRWAAAAFQLADGVGVRDPASAQAIRSLGVNRPITVGGDSALLMPVPADSGESEGFTVGGMRTVGIAPRPIKGKTDVAGLFGEACKLMMGVGLMPVLMAMDREEDPALILEISKRQGGKVPDLRKLQTPMQYQQRMARMDLVVAMRLHAAILATTVGTPSYCVSYDPKVQAFAKLLGLGNAAQIETLQPRQLVEQVQSLMKDLPKHQATVARKRSELVKQAEENVGLIREILG